MKNIFLSLAVLMLACGSDPNTQPEATVVQSGIHKVVVQEVIQTTNYTYVRGKEGEAEEWMAAPKTDVSVGGIFYYKESMPMVNFSSKELNRTFEKILFLEQFSPTPDIVKKEVAPTTPPMPNPHGADMEQPQTTSGAPEPEKQKIKTEPAAGGITIAELFKNKQSYAGKKVKIKGKVTKYNPYIMNKNWIHLQDGTEFSGKFDLTATTDIEVKPGDVITLEGIIALDKDFGFGYSYEVLMENAKRVE